MGLALCWLVCVMRTLNGLHPISYVDFDCSCLLLVEPIVTRLIEDVRFIESILVFRQISYHLESVPVQGSGFRGQRVSVRLRTLDHRSPGLGSGIDRSRSDNRE